MSLDIRKLLAGGIDRRTFMKLAAVTGGTLALSQMPFRPANAQDAAKIKFAKDRYRDFYDSKDGYFLKDQGWIDETLPRITWPKDGAIVPELSVLVQNTQPDWIDAWRRWAADAEKIGLKYKIEQVSQARWLEAILSHRHGDVEIHPAVPRPERLDPSEWLVSRAYGLDRRNYGEWANEQYDAAIEAQAATGDR